jgi:hypothetical protein
MADVEVFVDHVWAHAEVGTPPFVAGLYLRSTDSSPSTSPADLAAVFTDAWSTDLKADFWTGLGAGQLNLTIRGDDGETTYTAALDNATGSTQTLATGWAVRAVFESARLFKQRLNGCYFPLPDGGKVNQEGVVDSDLIADVASWGTTVLGALADTDFRWNSRHQLGGTSEPFTYAEVTGCHSAPTASFLRRRYR